MPCPELPEPRPRFYPMRTVNHLDEEQIQRSAEALIRTHGNNAGMVCAQTAERWMKRGDPHAAELWTKFMHACRKLLDAAPKR